MALFRRRRRTGEETVGRRVVVTDDLALDEEYAEDDLDLREDHAETVAPEPETILASDDQPALPRAETGPFDRSEVGDEKADRLDLGALWLGAAAGAELSIEVEEATGGVKAVTIAVAGSAMQVQAFAAPRSTGIWRTVRTEIADGVTGRGGAADERPGPLGTELLTRLPSQGPDGRVVYQTMRFIGVDGPRWFLRAVLTGPAASDEVAAEPYYAMLRNTVVVRGEEAMPPREMLPLRLPKELFQAPGDGEVAAGRKASDLDPFERGPEITEIR